MIIVEKSTISYIFAPLLKDKPQLNIFSHTPSLTPTLPPTLPPAVPPPCLPHSLPHCPAD